MTSANEAQVNLTIGANLRRVRERFGWTLREVQERSEALAAEWGHSDYQISASYLHRVEGGRSGMSTSKLVVLTAIYSLSAAEALALCSPAAASHPKHVQVTKPKATLLLEEGPLDDHAKMALPEEVMTREIPEQTQLLNRPTGYPSSYRRAIVGTSDRSMEPMIQSGSIILVDTNRKLVFGREEWTHEFNRPIYLVLTHASYLTGFCELDEEGKWLTLVPHALSYQSNQRWQYRREVEIIGEVVSFLARRY